MAWKCFMVTRHEHPPRMLESGGTVTKPFFVDGEGRIYEFETLPAGAMFHHGGKLYVMLPTRRFWCPQHPQSNTGQPWEITGTPPLITCTPSILCPRGYHGWLRHGSLSDDIDGRTYPQAQ